MKDRRKVKDSFVLQQDQADCGVACLLSVLRYYGGNASLEKLRELSGTRPEGTTLLGLYNAANAMGFKADGCEGNMEALMTCKKPVILHALPQGTVFYHYIICYGYKEGVFYIGDPAKGRIKLNKKELESLWHSKYCLMLEPQNIVSPTEKEKSLSLKWVLETVKPDFPVLAIGAMLGVIVTTLSMALHIFTGKLIDKIIPSANWKDMLMSVSLLGLLLLFRILFNTLRQSLLMLQSKSFNTRIVFQFFSALLNLKKAFFDTRKTGDLVTRLNDTERIQRVIGQVTTNSVVDIFTVLTAVSILCYYSWEIGLISIFSLPIFYFIIIKHNKKINTSQKDVMATYGYNESNYINSIQGISAIKNFNAYQYFSEINRMIYGAYQQKTMELNKLNLKLSIWANVMAILFLLTVIATSTSLVFLGKIKSGDLLTMLGIASTLFPSIISLAMITVPLNEAKVAYQRMFDLVHMDAERETGEPLSEFYRIEMKEVSFGFPGRAPVLKDISMNIKSGEITALIGESGSGKSTIAQMVQSFYGVTAGEIIINGNIPLNKINLHSWRDKVAVVPQEIHLFNGNVLSNIAMKKLSDEEAIQVKDFCKEFGLNKYIEKFPGSYDTPLGEAGINISGGQKQILALARALYKNPQLLILDEATASMDKRMEAHVMELLQKLKEKMAILLITHRLHQLERLCDNIYLLEGGKIILDGKHQQPLEKGNRDNDDMKSLKYA